MDTSEFIDAIIHAGQTPPPVVLPDGQIHRYPVENGNGKVHGKSGWYVVRSDGPVPVGFFGDWKKGTSIKWVSRAVNDLDYLDRAQVSALLAQVEKERKVKQEEEYQKASESANLQYHQSRDCQHDHPYLKNKKVSALPGVRQTGMSLVIPVLSPDHKIQSIQYIRPDGKKKFLPKGKMKGGFFVIHGDDTLLICEGYATGATLHRCTGHTVYVAFNAGNLLPVAQMVKEQHTDKTIIVCGDNDRGKPENVGAKKANEAANAIKAKVLLPIPPKGTDFNDLANSVDDQAVKAMFLHCSHFKPLTPAETSVSQNLTEEPAPAEYLMNCRGYGFLRTGIVGLLVASGGTGKSFLLLKLAVVLAGGDRWGCFDAMAPRRVLLLAAEDDQEEMYRRLWAISPNNFPGNLFCSSVMGKIGPFMKLDGANPVKTEWFDWLDATIEAHKPLDILIIDPLSRVYGLKENSNEDATAFISTLESLTLKHGTTILLAHHSNKESSQQRGLTQGMSRGAASFVDSGRMAIGLRSVEQEDIDKYQLENPNQFFKMQVLKTNGGRKPDAPIFFKKNDDTGVPEIITLSDDGQKRLATAFLEAFAAFGNPVKERDLLRGQPTDLFNAIRGNLQSFSAKKHMKGILSWIEENGMAIVTSEKYHGKTSKTFTPIMEDLSVEDGLDNQFECRDVELTTSGKQGLDTQSN